MIKTKEEINKNKKTAKNGDNNNFLKRLIIFAIISVVILSIGFGFKSKLENLLNNRDITENLQIDENGLTAHFVDVGQGDSIAIKFPDGKKMLVDAGTTSSSDKLVEYLKIDFFKNEPQKFDYLLLTHSDSDHCGGMPDICKEFEIEKIYRPMIYSTKVLNDSKNSLGKNDLCDTEIYRKTIEAFNKETSNIVFNQLQNTNDIDKIEGSSYSIDFYSPTSNYCVTSHAMNDVSPIMVINYNGKKIMLTGDCSTQAEKLAMEKFNLPDIDILKVGHHGSSTSSGKDFLNKILPEYSIISVGSNNTYKHPAQDALNRLECINSKIFRTDLNGNIVANISSEAAAKILINMDTQNGKIYIHIEYIIVGLIVLDAYFCFGIKGNIKKRKKK